MVTTGIAIIIAVAAAVVFGAAGYIIGGLHRKKVAEATIGSANKEAARIVNEALTEAETKKKEAILEAKDEIHKMRLEKVLVVATDLEEGNKVEVLEGALNGFVGTVVSVDAVANKCRVIVEMFGRETPVDLSLEQVKKVD